MLIDPQGKYRLVNILDAHDADAERLPEYSLDIILSRSPRQQKLVGGIVWWKRHDLTQGGLVDRLIKLDGLTEAQKLRRQREAQEMANAAGNFAEQQFREITHFSKSEGRWVDWALEQALAFYDQKRDVAVSIQVPRLRYSCKRGPKSLARLRSHPEVLFPDTVQVTALLEHGFEYDQGSKVIRKATSSLVTP